MTPTRLACRARAFWLCRVSLAARLDTLVSTRSTRQTCCVMMRRYMTTLTSQVEFGLKCEERKSTVRQAFKKKCTQYK